MTTEYDITAIKGANLKLRFTALDCNSSPIDLTQYTASGFVRLKYSSTENLLNLNPTIHSSFVSGFIDIDVPASSLSGLPITQAVYDIGIYHNTTGYIGKVAKGRLNINPATTY